MNILKNILFAGISLLLCSTVSLYAQEVRVLTWEDCVKEAIKNNPDLASSKEDLEMTKTDKLITQSSVLPQLTADFSYKRDLDDNSNRHSYSLTGRQLLFDGLKIFHEIYSAKESIKASEQSFRVASSNVRLSLRTAFAELLKAEKLIFLTEEISKRRKQNFELVKLRYDAGREHKGALLTAKADLAQAEFEVREASRKLTLAQTELAKELGTKTKELIKIVGDFKVNEIKKEEPDFEKLATNTPSVREFFNKKKAAKYELKSKVANYFPWVYLSASVGKSTSSWISSDLDWLLGISASFPLFEGGGNFAEHKKASSKFRKAEADLASARISAVQAIKETWLDLQDKIEEKKVEEKYLEASEERAKIANSQYSTGLISFDDWIIIENNLVAVKKSFLDAKKNVLIAEAKWVNAKGGTLDYEEKN